MATGARRDPHVISFFRIEIDSIESGSFRKCAGLKTETEVFEYQEGGNNESVRKLIGPSKASNIVLTKGYVSDPALFKWRGEIASPSNKKVARRNGSIVAVEVDGKTEGGRWNFQKAWPGRGEATEFDGTSGHAPGAVRELAVGQIAIGEQQGA